MSNNPRILIIEDEMINARFIEETITQHFDADVTICHTYDKAKTLLESTINPFDLHLVDVNLKHTKDGIDLMHEFEHLGPRIIFITAHSNTGLLLKAKSLNPLGYIIKPIDEVQLKVLIELYLESYASLNTHAEIKKLTPSEFKVCQKIAEGLASTHIADELSVSTKTVENHRYNICKKLSLPSEKNSLLHFVLSHQNFFKQ